MKRQSIQRGREVERFFLWCCLAGSLIFLGQLVTNYVSSGQWWR